MPSSPIRDKYTKMNLALWIVQAMLALIFLDPLASLAASAFGLG